MTSGFVPFPLILLIPFLTSEEPEGKEVEKKVMEWLCLSIRPPHPTIGPPPEVRPERVGWEDGKKLEIETVT